MTRKHKFHSDKFKLKVALSALKGEKTVAELCKEFEIAASQLYAWKKHVEESADTIFSAKARKSGNSDVEIDRLHATIGKLKVENDFLVKALGR